MKRILISLLLILLLPYRAYANSYTSTSTISMYANILPSYSVKIPKSLNITNNTTYFKYSIIGDIYYDQTLQILFDEKTHINCENKQIEVNVNQEKSQYSSNEISNSIQSKVCLSHANLSPGEWSGQLNVVISLIGGA